MRYLFSFFILVFFLHLHAQNENDTIIELDPIDFPSQSIFPKDKKLIQSSSSTLYINQAELQKQNYTNPLKILEGISGVHLYEEDGFGLRPNISIRGTAPERSEKINLMEDGIPISPAPYAAPAAYYFPNVFRMQGIEIIKGSGQIKYGPNTVGGSINYLSKKVPHSLKTEIDASYGNFNSQYAQLLVGNKTGKFAYMINYSHINTDGFKDLPNNLNTGFEKNDWVGKIQFKDQLFGNPLMLQFKYQYSDENSNETYLGLTDEDFKTQPYSRYMGSSLDKMINEHQQYSVTANYKINNNIELNFDAYRNTFGRNWYKTQSVDAGNGNTSLDKIFDDPIQYNSEYLVLKGTFNGENTLFLRNNNRDYLAKGIQLTTDIEFKTQDFFHDIHLGTRYHYDESDRFQWEDQYQVFSNYLSLTNVGIPGSQSNQVDNALAFSSYIQYQLSYFKWKLTTGLRYENIHFERLKYTNDLERTGEGLSVRENNNKEWIPSISVSYLIQPQFNIFMGLHKGFSPSGSTPNQESENSWNYEIGTRYHKNNVLVEGAIFINDYSQLLGSDLQAAGGEGNNDLLNAGAVIVKGLEFFGRYTFNYKSVEIPFQINYTYNSSEFSKDFTSELYGEVFKGDHLPYIPRHQFKAEIGLNYQKWNFNFSGRYLSERITIAGDFNLPSKYKIDAYTVYDASVHYQIIDHKLRIFATAENVFNTVYAVSRAPYGLRPGIPFYGKIGMSLRL